MAKNVIRQDVVQISFEVDNSPLNGLAKELDLLKKDLKGDFGDGAFDELAKSSKQAKESVDDIKTSVGDLIKSTKKTKESIGDVEDALGGVKTEAEKTKKSLGGIAMFGFDKVKSGLDKFKTGFDKVKDVADKFKQKLIEISKVGFDKLKSGLNSVGKKLVTLTQKAAKWAAVGIGAGTAALTKVVKDSVTAYADREQFIGGVETMFKGDAGTIQKYANDAYKAAGLSANEYVESVTSFSASLISGLGGDTKKAAEYANTAMVDMSDNANKFGTDMSMIQNAYQGFAKQNYMMLDNLKLGYGGTKTEMERLIKDAAKIDKSIKANDLSFGNIVRSIHVVQKEMGVTGTTAKEASTTILGSFNSMKSAWKNLLPALIEGGDSFDQCINNLADSAETFLKNLKPALTKAVTGIGNLIDRLAPILEEEAPRLVNELLPPLIRAATKIVAGLIKELPNIVRTLVPELIKAIYEGFSGQRLADGTIEALKGKVDKLMPVILGIAGALAGFKALTKLKGLLGGIMGLFFSKKEKTDTGGGLFGSLTKIFSDLAKTKTTTVLKGMANMGIILGGMTLIAAAFMAIAPHIAKLSDIKSFVKVIAVVGILGLLGAALAKLAGVIGMIPIAMVLKGFANMATVLLGFGALAAVFAWIAPYISQLSDFKSILKVTGIMLLLAVLGTALTVLAGVAGIVPFPVVLAGLANIATVLGGMEALILAFGALSKIPGFNDFMDSGSQLLIKLCKTIGEMAGSIIGGVGEGITNSLPKIGENLSNFAEALKPAFDIFNGADINGIGNFFKGFAEFMLVLTGDKLASIFTGKTNYADLGAQLSAFAANAKGFFDAVAALPEEGFAKARLFFETLAGVESLPTEGGIKGWFNGSINYEGLSNGLTQLSNDNVKSFFDFCAGLNTAGFETAKGLFNTLAEVKGLPKDGGVISWFTGRIAYDSLSAGLAQLSSEDVKGFFAWLSGVDSSVFEKTKQLFASLAEVKGLPKEGGITSWFSGKMGDGMKSLASGLPALGEGAAAFYSSIASITDFSKMGQLFAALSGIDGMVEKDGGFFNWVSDKLGGDSKTGLQLLGEVLLSFGNNTQAFFNQVNALDIGKLQAFWGVVKEMGTSALDVSEFNLSLTELVGIVERSMDEIVTIINAYLSLINRLISGFSLISAGQSMMDSLIAGLNSKKAAVIATAALIAGAIKAQFSGAISAVGSSINKMISGGNFILKELGSGKRLNTWSYAGGTDGHKGGNAIVNDGRGAELVQMPNGNAFIPNGRNVFMPNAPKGMKVLSAENTAQFMGKSSPTFHYAKGTGKIDIWSYIDNSKGLANKVIENYVGKINTGSFAGNVSQGIVDTSIGSMAAWIKKMFDETGGLSLASYVPSKGVEQWRSTVIRALQMEGLYSEANVARTLFQMKTESSGNPRAINLWDINAVNGVPSKGLMQVIDPTFRAYARPGFNSNIYDPLSNILASIRYAVSRYGSLARAYRGVGYANGGIATKPSIFGEAGAEMAIPLSKSKRKRGLSLWEQTGDMLGAEKYTPESSVSYSKSQTTEYNTYSPQFTLNITGSNDDRAMERKVKKWLYEAMEEAFDSIARKSPRLQEV